ncbi:MAG: glycosyltransferase [Actinomycetales bacterium]|nr:glycosyltransferase [Actinomycetales bacterium]
MSIVKDAPRGAVPCMALAECIIDGTRRQPGEWFHVEGSRWPHLVQVGLVVSHPMLNLMAPEARAIWGRITRQRGRAAGLAETTLAVPQPIVEQLWDADGRILTPFDTPSRYQPSATIGGDPRPVRVLQLCEYDPGCSVYRYHSAANVTPGLQSALVRWDYNNPHCHLRQWDGEADQRTVEALAMTADVIHVHMNYATLLERLRYLPQAWQRVVITYHGSSQTPAGTTSWTYPELDQSFRALRLGARPYHLRHRVADAWLPIPMPVADYRQLPKAPRREGRPFRVAHSPTKRSIKGTEQFVTVCRTLTEQEGLRIEPVVLEGMDHGAALAAKATCDAVFDSFWLGIQGSGLEGAAMGLPVLAGDPEAQGDLTRQGIPVPWTIANDGAELREQLRRLATDPAFYAAEATRAVAYVARWHDYSVVGARYKALLDDLLARDD